MRLHRCSDRKSDGPEQFVATEPVHVDARTFDDALDGVCVGAPAGADRGGGYGRRPGPRRPDSTSGRSGRHRRRSARWPLSTSDSSCSRRSANLADAPDSGAKLQSCFRRRISSRTFMMVMRVPHVLNSEAQRSSSRSHWVRTAADTTTRQVEICPAARQQPDGGDGSSCQAPSRLPGRRSRSSSNLIPVR
jgi:hypothetical protein